RVDVLEHRQPECRGLAAAGLGLPDHVVTCEQLGDGLRLDRRGLDVAELVERLQQALGQPEVLEGGGNLLRITGRARARPRITSWVHQAEGSRSSLPLVRRSCISVWARATSLRG